MWPQCLNKGKSFEMDVLVPPTESVCPSDIDELALLLNQYHTHQTAQHESLISSLSQQPSAWSFTQGLIIGQLSVIILLIAFIRFFIFTESAPLQATPVNSKISKHLEDDQPTELESILEKTYYDVTNHPPESLDWFNVLIAQIISQARFEALANDNIKLSLTQALNNEQIHQFCDQIKINEINIGNDFPIFSNCRVRNREGRLEAKIDVDVADTFTLGLETNLIINQPRIMSACLPVKLSISLVRFSSCLTVSLITDHSEKEDGKNGGSIALMFSFSPDFRLEFKIKSLLGSKAKLENIPRIGNLIENVLRKWFIDRCIEPKFQVIKLPSLVPRKKNTREDI
ncbi:ERMES complex subunit [Martiniozyma asiatica (nom. inval.)]|nr:ERMES complex subunit [Martiniozyma asiatica]